MAKVVVIGGGWSGCAAAISAKKAGADVILLERTDLLLGLGNVGGVMRNNGRYTAAEECISLGGGELFEITDRHSRHVAIEFPGHKHASIYDVRFVESSVRKKLLAMNIEIKFISRVANVQMKERVLEAVILENGDKIFGDSFIDTTGSTGPLDKCYKYGTGCAMCILRCPSYGGRVSISEKCGVKDRIGRRKDGSIGSFSGAIKIDKETLREDLHEKLNQEGVLVLPLPEEDINSRKLQLKICRQYALDEYMENLIILDTGHAKLFAPFYPLEKLRKIQGFENVRFTDPYSAGMGNSIRHLAIAPRNNCMKVVGVNNLFTAGEKSGFYIGHTEAIVTGYLAGHNSVRNVIGAPLLMIPSSLAIGDMISYSNEIMNKDEENKSKFTFSGADYFERMKCLNLYTVDDEVIRNRVKSEGLINVYDDKII